MAQFALIWKGKLIQNSRITVVEWKIKSWDDLLGIKVRYKTRILSQAFFVHFAPPPKSITAKSLVIKNLGVSVESWRRIMTIWKFELGINHCTLCCASYCLLVKTHFYDKHLLIKNRNGNIFLWRMSPKTFKDVVLCKNGEAPVLMEFKTNQEI